MLFLKEATCLMFSRDRNSSGEPDPANSSSHFTPPGLEEVVEVGPDNDASIKAKPTDPEPTSESSDSGWNHNTSTEPWKFPWQK